MKNPNVHCFKNTSDNWHPNFAGNQCMVYIAQARPADDAFFVGVCGDDDDMWVSAQGSVIQATMLYLKVAELEDVTKDVLATMGFERS